MVIKHSGLRSMKIHTNVTTNSSNKNTSSIIQKDNFSAERPNSSHSIKVVDKPCDLVNQLNENKPDIDYGRLKYNIYGD